MSDESNRATLLMSRGSKDSHMNHDDDPMLDEPFFTSDGSAHLLEIAQSADFVYFRTLMSRCYRPGRYPIDRNMRTSSCGG